MSHAIRVHQHGGPEVLQWEKRALPAPATGEVQVRHTAIGLNFIDVYQRTGLYPPPALPFTPGLEAAGVVTTVGPGASEFAVGDRVGYADVLGAYSDLANLPADRLIPLPDALDDASAAAMMLKGMTAEYLLFRSYRVQAGDTIVVHAAAGGVGQILCQWASRLGATVIGTVSNEAKAELARAAGCHHPIIYTHTDFASAVRDLTDGRGVPVVYDSVGRDTFDGSLGCLQTFGLLVSFGQSSGKVPPLDVTTLSAKGSLFLTRPTLMHHIRQREALLAIAGAVFEAAAQGLISVPVRQQYALADAAQAHRDLQDRKTSGSTVLIPE